MYADWREPTTRLLLRGSALLTRTALRLAQVRPRSERSIVEFHAERGAEGGTLFVNGQRVGMLTGVRRL
ncbi:hypothetical protein PFX98_04065 [Paucibacter sediminis]|uniref:Uncharacterized protein n=1 Tax=Paucibacter sediminis TaxID=3019553 RepID=A0AA95SXF3_9BURK|nr:hypothetical protein [Paucibacter sp. S2-9]WIT12799.1 hypothetical protein PFX98_04065 [Paucibacter sp. S2-9]